MPHRDPETGQFVADHAEAMGYDDVEHIHAGTDFTIAAADANGQTGPAMGQQINFEGVQITDFDEVIDRNERAELLYVDHRVEAYAPSTETADGTVVGTVEISAAPSRQVSGVSGSTAAVGDATGPLSRGVIDFEESRDIIGPWLRSVSYAPFSDGATGVGGAGSSQLQQWDGRPPGSWGFDPRDELFINGVLEQSNIDDAAVKMDVQVYHAYGVTEQ